MTERDMLDLLLNRYTFRRQGTFADRWVRAEHVRNGLGYNANRIADFIAADKYPGVPYGSDLAFHGHEVKVSRSDWLVELRDPEKSEAFKRYMHYWWLVVPDASIVKVGELPDGWGLMVAAGGKLRAKVKARRLTPEPMPLDMVISFASAAQKTAHREPLHHDAPIAHVGWEARCGWCGELVPCPLHQPRAFEQNGSSMTEHDTPSTAHTEAWEYVRRLQDDGAFFRQQVDIDQAIDDFAAGAEWALAQVREGLAGIETSWDDGLLDFDRSAIAFQADALAVVDRLEGKP